MSGLTGGGSHDYLPAGAKSQWDQSRLTTTGERRFARRRKVFWLRGPWRCLPPSTRKNHRAALIALVGLMALAANSSPRAQNATWLATPGSGNFNTGANWSPAIVPTGVASFNASSITALSLSSSTTIGGFTLNAGASSYVFALSFPRVLTFTGAGITINGGAATINNGGTVNFDNTSSAGSATINNHDGLFFNNNSTAGAANIANTNTVSFSGASSAGAATISSDNLLEFSTHSTAGNSTIVTQSGGYTAFFGNSNGGTAQLIAQFHGFVDFSDSSGPAGNHVITVGSIAGAGNFYLGANDLVVGGNNLSTTVSGVISDCGTTGAMCLAFPATSGSLTKVGSGVLTLTGANTYTGATTIVAGSTLALAGTGSISSSSNVADNGLFTIAGLTNGGTSIRSLSGGGVVALGANTLALSNASGVFSGAIGGTGGLTLDAGRETLTGASNL
jgi:autotransporter-associated beta strand protein